MSKMENSLETIKNFVTGNKHKDLEKYNDNRLTSEKVMGRDMFFKLLTEQGEAISESELQDILRVLRGDTNYKSMPESFTFQYLFEELMKFELSEKKDEEV
jgi:hypothetical protein